jgi:uncharacterized protein YjbJ (UPF0337 family)
MAWLARWLGSDAFAGTGRPFVTERDAHQPRRSKEVFMKDQVRGKAEEIKGKVTGDRGEEMKGKARQMVGKAKSTVRDVKADVRVEVKRKRTSR